MIFLKFVGWVSAVFGIMFLIMPKTLLKINHAVNKMLLDLDATLYKLRVGIGISLCLVSATMFFIVYYLAQRFGMR